MARPRDPTSAEARISEAIATRRRRPPGRSGGKHVSKVFFLVKGDGRLYPDESERMSSKPESVMPETFRQSWLWALGWLDTHRDHWLMVPMTEPRDTLLRFREKNSIRSSIWRTSRRNGFELESLEWKDAMWFRVIDL